MKIHLHMDVKFACNVSDGRAPIIKHSIDRA